MHHFFFFNDTAATEIDTLSLHDALPICRRPGRRRAGCDVSCRAAAGAALRLEGLYRAGLPRAVGLRSEEHTSELQSLTNLVCRLLLEKKKMNNIDIS